MSFVKSGKEKKNEKLELVNIDVWGMAQVFLMHEHPGCKSNFASPKNILFSVFSILIRTSRQGGYYL